MQLIKKSITSIFGIFNSREKLFLDYNSMHNLFLGVTRRLLQFWFLPKYSFNLYEKMDSVSSTVSLSKNNMHHGPKKHLKRVVTPNHWMLDKMSGIIAPKPRPGPHKSRESIPLLILIRNHLKYALTYREAVMILKGRNVKVDGKVRTY
jgi:hypothetical protein